MFFDRERTSIYQFCFTPASTYLQIFFFLEMIWNLLWNLILWPTKNFIAFLLLNSPIWNFWCFFIHSSLPMRKSGLITLTSEWARTLLHIRLSKITPGCHIHVIRSLLKICFNVLPHLSEGKIFCGEKPHLSDTICLSKNSPDSWLINNSLNVQFMVQLFDP